jgi:hypothetical protein
MRYDHFKVILCEPDGRRTRLIKTRNLLVAYAVLESAKKENPYIHVYASAYGFDGSCVWCDGYGDTSNEPEAAEAGYGYVPTQCGACFGTTRAIHPLDAAYRPRDDEPDYYEEKYGSGSGPSSASVEGFRAVDDPQYTWF